MLPIETEIKQNIRIEKKLTVEIADIVHTFKGNSNLSKTEKSFDIKVRMWLTQLVWFPKELIPEPPGPDCKSLSLLVFSWDPGR